MILMIHMIDTGNIVGHIFGANFGKYTDTSHAHDTSDTDDTYYIYIYDTQDIIHMI